MDTQICKITFPDGTWIKAELPTGDERIDYVLDNFGMFASIENLPETDAAVVASKGATVASDWDLDNSRADAALLAMKHPRVVLPHAEGHYHCDPR